MEKSVLHEFLASYNQRNNILYLLLGLAALSERWSHLILAESLDVRQAGQAIRSQPEETNPGLMYFLLGMIAFTDHFHALLSGVRHVPLVGETLSEAAPSMNDLRGLLR